MTGGGPPPKFTPEEEIFVTNFGGRPQLEGLLAGIDSDGNGTTVIKIKIFHKSPNPP